MRENIRRVVRSEQPTDRTAAGGLKIHFELTAVGDTSYSVIQFSWCESTIGIRRDVRRLPSTTSIAVIASGGVSRY